MIRIILVASVLALTACSGQGDTELDAEGTGAGADVSEVTLKELQNTLFAPNCVVCHNPGGSAWDDTKLDFTSADTSYATTVDVAALGAQDVSFVVAGDPDASYLLAKVEGTQTSLGGVGSSMPAGNPISAELTAKLRAWIAAGAPEKGVGTPPEASESEDSANDEAAE